MTTTNGTLDKFFQLTARKTSVRQEIIGGVTTFLAMVYSVILVPAILGDAGFDKQSVFIATCVMSGLATILLGLWSNLPLAIGAAISLTAFVAYNLVLGQGISVAVAMGAILLMGLVFLVVTLTGVRTWILNNIPKNIAIGTGIGIGLFLMLIASNNVGFSVTSPNGLPMKAGDFMSFPVLTSLAGLALIVGLERLRVTGAILIVVILLTVVGIIFDPKVSLNGFIGLPTFDSNSANFFKFDLSGAFTVALLPVVFALVITAIFDATGTIRAVADQAGLVDEKGEINNANRALTADSVGSLISGTLGTAPAAVYIESASGSAAGARTGLSSVVVGILFLATLFLAPFLTIVPSYATAPALMYVGLLMLSNVAKMDFEDRVSLMAGLITASFILLTTNIVTGIMLGFVALVIGKIISKEWNSLNLGTVIIAVLLLAFYLSGLAL